MKSSTSRAVWYLILVFCGVSNVLSLKGQISQVQQQSHQTMPWQDTSMAIAMYATYSKSTDTTYTPIMLTGGSTTYLNVISDGSVSYCTPRCVKRAYLRITFHAGGTDQEYRHGKITNDQAIVQIKLDGLNSTDTVLLNIPAFTMKVSLHSPDSLIPEQMYIYDLSDNYPDHCDDMTTLNISRIRCGIQSYTAPSASAIASDMRLDVELVEEYAIDARYSGVLNCSDTTTVMLRASSVTGTNPVTFAWGNNPVLCQSDSFPNYQFQLLRLYNTDTTYRNDSLTIKAVVDWEKALTVETYGPKQELTLTVPEGTGFYVWRVRPIGDRYPNGIGNDTNWGCWSKAPPQGSVVTFAKSGGTITTTPIQWPYACMLYYYQFNDTLNWIYGRVFTEGQNSRPGISEQITFANGLMMARQTQKHLMSTDTTVASTTVYDFSGRPAIQSMAAPVQQGKLGYINQLMKNGSSLYTAAHFDTDANYRNPSTASGPIHSYYSDDNPDLTIPSADGLPFTRTIFAADASSQVIEQTGVGATHQIGSGRGNRTVRALHSGVMDKELVSVMGDEAPIDSAARKIVTVDQNKVASVSYQAKDGRVLATCLVYEGNSALLSLDETVNTLTFTDTLRNTYQPDPYTIVASRPVNLVDTVNVTVNYDLTPETFSVSCEEYCATCDYEIIRSIKRVAPDTATILLDTFLLPAASCPAESGITKPQLVFNLLPGNYVFERTIRTNTKDTTIIMIVGGDPDTVITPWRDKHELLVDLAFRSRIADRLDDIFGTTLLSLYHNPDAVKTDSLYEALLDNYISYYNGLGEDKRDSLAPCCKVELPPSPCDDGSAWCSPTVNFEQYLYDWGSPHGLSSNLGQYFVTIDGQPKYPGQTTGKFNALITNMLASGDYTCKELWRCWQSVVLGLGMSGFVSDGNGNPTTTRRDGFDLLEAFLDCVGRRYCGFSSNAYGANGYLDYAWKYYQDPSTTKSQDCKISMGYNATPTDSLWHCGVGASDSAANANHLQLALCFTAGEPVTYWQAKKDLYADACTTRACLDTLVWDMEDSCRSACEGRRNSFRDSLAMMYFREGYMIEGYNLFPDPPVLGTISAFDLSCMVGQLVRNCSESCELTIVENSGGDSIISIGTTMQIENFTNAYMNPYFQVKLPVSGVCASEFTKVEKMVPIGSIVADMLNFYLQRCRDTMQNEVIGWNYLALWNALKAEYPGLNACSVDSVVLVSKKDSSWFEFVYDSTTVPHKCKVQYHEPTIETPVYSSTNPHPLVSFLNSALDVSWGARINSSDFTPTDTCQADLGNGDFYTWLGGSLNGGVEDPLKLRNCIDSTSGLPEFCDFKLPCVFYEPESWASSILQVNSEVTDAFRVYPTDQTLRATGTIKFRFWGFYDYEFKLTKQSCDDGPPKTLSFINFSTTVAGVPINRVYPVFSRDELEYYLNSSFSDRIGKFDMVDTQLVYRDLISGVIIPIPQMIFSCENCDSVKTLCESSGLCDSTSCGSVCFRWKNMDTSYAPAFVFKPKSCAQQAIERLLPALESAYGTCLNRLRLEVDSAYRTACATPSNIHDAFRYSFSTSYHHYTLYYYDRVGNLIKTIPPKGVNLSGANTRTRLDHPAHTMVTEYEYNSLKQLVRQSTPDGGETRFWYNGAGQLRLSQDARQAALSPVKYSYTKYDNLGRTIEVGETGIGISTPQSFADNGTLPTSGQTETTTTVYSAAAGGVVYQPGSKPQRYLQNRVSYTTTADGVSTYYSYDPHGNVEWVIQELPGLGKSMARYDYDLISGKVLGVVYQEKKPDRLHIRYSYDDDSRLVQAETSRDGWLWESEARYNYYGHGPLRRAELGHDRIQGIDYVYTIHGWLKGLNHPALTLNPTYDPGGDGTGSSVVAADAYGMILGYYAGDFQRSYSSTQSKYNSGSSVHAYNLNGTSLYNGNIATWLNHLQATGNKDYQDEVLTGSRYRYDLLNRLREDRYFKFVDGDWDDKDNYDSEYQYDPNGNITYLNRYAGTYGQIDALDYNYEQPNQTNRLEYIKDAGYMTGLYAGDIDTQLSSNYGYDESGNLIRDAAEGIATGAIKWMVYGKVYEVTEQDSTRMKYYYDAAGNRVKKEKHNYSGGSYTLSKTTWYVYDAGGTVLGVYEKNYSGDTAVVLWEMPLYGSSRIGMLLPNVKRYSTTPDTVGIFSRYVDRRVYELSDHLGNVRAIVGDVKLPVSGSYKADLKGYSNYYPFGMLQPDRYWSSDSYRYGYNGKEMDDEIKGKGTSYDYGARMYDPRVGRWMSRDPLEEKYVGLSPYNFALNTPIQATDPDGKVVIFINGLWGFWGGVNEPNREYWGDSWVRSLQRNWHDFKDPLFFDGSSGGQLKFFRNASTTVRWSKGFKSGYDNAKVIIDNLSPGETIKYVTNSMGSAFQRGFSAGVNLYVMEQMTINSSAQQTLMHDINAIEGTINRIISSSNEKAAESLPDLQGLLLGKKQELLRLRAEYLKLESVTTEIVVDIEPHGETEKDPYAQRHYYILSDQSKYNWFESTFLNIQPVKGATDASKKIDGTPVTKGHHSSFTKPENLPK